MVNGQPVVDGCGNACGETGVYCADGTCSGASCGMAPGHSGGQDVGDGWQIKCTDWNGNQCRGMQLFIPPGQPLDDGWWNLNYHHGVDADNACQLFCALAGTTMQNCHHGVSPGSGDNPNRRIVELGVSGSELSLPTGPDIAISGGSGDLQNLSVTCDW